MNAAAASVTAARIRDRRRLAAPYGQVPFACRVNVTAAGAASALNIVAPPTVRIGAHGDGATAGRFSIYVFPGELVALGGMDVIFTATAQQAGGPGASNIWYQDADALLGLMTSAEQVSLTGAGTTGSPLDMYIRPDGSGGAGRIRADFSFSLAAAIPRTAYVRGVLAHVM